MGLNGRVARALTLGIKGHFDLILLQFIAGAIVMEKPQVEIFVVRNSADMFQEKEKSDATSIEKQFPSQISGNYCSLFRKFKQAKECLKLYLYLKYVIAEIANEVESMFMCIFFFLLYFVMLIVGVNYEFSEKVDCIADPLLSVSVIESGLIGCLVNMISLMYLFTGVRQRYVEKCRCIFQCVLFVNNVLGLFHVYSIWKPDVLDTVNPDYCHFQLYWISFFCFHCAAVFYIVIFSLLLGGTDLLFCLK
ncbi:hypothetical protein CEXT_412651 [Caerostris extrusa]|uniref:Uncharacterized protein n=1 Tax=Caerostris extrusa TaxID=172846 RepID=A0AAV4RW52_CAEEX|nr:hypothetical protein CEXT_412651 [Caerostris extrusa]